MSLDLTDLLKVVGYAESICEKSGLSLDTEIISAQYNSYRANLDRPYEYELQDMQVALDQLINKGTLDGCVTRISGVIVKVVLF
ncbi:hypothetical protein D3C79_603160 [compost metagenome]